MFGAGSFNPAKACEMLGRLDSGLLEFHQKKNIPLDLKKFSNTYYLATYFFKQVLFDFYMTRQDTI